jgi:hypothetical protein
MNGSDAHAPEKRAPPEQRRYPLELSDTWLHFNGLLWKVPSVGVAIAVGVIVAAAQVGDRPGFRFAILLVGTVFLLALSAATCKHRTYQAASTEPDPPNPPFDGFPKANSALQFALGLTTGVLLALTFASYLRMGCAVVVGLSGGAISFVLFEWSARQSRATIDGTRSGREA